MTTSNKPENLNTNPAHDLGQISINTILDFIEGQANAVEQRLKQHISRVEEFELTAQIRQLDAITLFLISQQTQTHEVREGMSDYVGPPRPVWHLAKNHGGRDPYASTGMPFFGRSLRDEWWSGSSDVAPLDAPNEIAAGGHRQNIFTDDAELNVFPITISRS